MRIIAGEFRSRRIYAPEDDTVTRPIPDRVKESLFGLLRGHCEGATVFDGFAGTGAIGLEAVSRCATQCLFVEKDRYAARMLQANIELLGVQDRCELVQGDALGAGALARCPRPLTLAFLDPPYALIEDPIGFRRVMDQLARLVEILSDDGFAILRTPWPMFLKEPAAAPPRAPRRPRVQRGRKPSRGMEEWTDGKSPAEVEPEAEQAPAPAPPARREVPDLRIPIAAGPETHTYHNMAVHLYMKKGPSVP